MGGNLRIEAKTSGKTARVEPIIDRVVFFYSDARNPHEVLPAYKDRLAAETYDILAYGSPPPIPEFMPVIFCFVCVLFFPFS